jgi:precorrin-6B methylase 2
MSKSEVKKDSRRVLKKMPDPKKLMKEQFEKNKNGWKKSFLTGFCQDENCNYLPWMTYGIIDFLKKNLTKNHEIFEFGCGASTLFFAGQVKKVISLETNPRWFKILQNMLAKKGYRNVEMNLMADGLENKLYENFIKNFEQKFDFVIIDALKRFECAKNSVDALKADGIIILDDSDRKNYQKIFDFFAQKGLKKQDFRGIAPGQLKIKNSTIFSF